MHETYRTANPPSLNDLNVPLPEPDLVDIEDDFLGWIGTDDAPETAADFGADLLDLD